MSDFRSASDSSARRCSNVLGSTPLGDNATLNCANRGLLLELLDVPADISPVMFSMCVFLLSECERTQSRADPLCSVNMYAFRDFCFSN